MAWQVSQWFPCLVDTYRETIISCLENFAPGQYLLPESVWQAILALNRMDATDEAQFLAWFYGVKSKTGLPYPLDEIVTFNSARWSAIATYYSDVYLGNNIECNIFTFPGNQGGSWPVRWPVEDPQ